jgi:cytochrome P450
LYVKISQGTTKFGYIPNAHQLISLYALYNAYLHPLRSYPGPFLWRSFRIPYVVSTHRGELHRRLKDFHTKYGPIVRIAPNELSYADSVAWKDIYLNRSGHPVFERNRTWFKKMSPDEPNSIMGFDEDDHSRFRRAFANSFSDKSLRDQAPVVERYIDLFISKLKEETGIIDLAAWFNYLTFDLSGDLSFGESFQCLESGQAHAWVAVAQDFGKGLALIASINQYHIDKLLRYIIPKKVLQRTKDHRAISSAKARKRLALQGEIGQRPDFVTPTKTYIEKHPDLALTTAEWEINMLVIAFAASETTASALTASVRELCQHRGTLARLVSEIRSAFPHESDITVASTQHLPYLNAVINETLRLDPPVVIGVPRICPKAGAQICNRYVPAGTYVTYNQFAANRQAYNFHLPNSFVPERFLEKDEQDNFEGWMPFATGRHSCIGMKLAYAEMRVALAKLIWTFDLALANEGGLQDEWSGRWDWGRQRTFIFWDKAALNVVLTPAHHKQA